MPSSILSLGAILCLSTIPLIISTGTPDASPAKGNSTIDITSIVQQSARVTEADRRASFEYDFSETDWEPDDSHKTYAVRMLYGSPYRQLIAIDATSLPRDEQQEEQHKLREEISRRAHESPEQRAHRIAEYDNERTRDRRFIEEFVRASNFKLKGEEKLDGHEVYVVDAVPRRDFHPTDRESTVLTGMRGTLFIDKQTDQWVKAEAEVTQPVSIVGFIARVEPGTRFVLEKMEVDDGVWLPRHFAMTAKAAIFSFIPHRKHEDVAFFDYHKAKQPPS
jgi:hypothetical protein